MRNRKKGYNRVSENATQQDNTEVFDNDSDTDDYVEKLVKKLKLSHQEARKIRESYKKIRKYQDRYDEIYDDMLSKIRSLEISTVKYHDDIVKLNSTILAKTKQLELPKTEATKSFDYGKYKTDLDKEIKQRDNLLVEISKNEEKIERYSDLIALISDHPKTLPTVNAVMRGALSPLYHQAQNFAARRFNLSNREKEHVMVIYHQGYLYLTNPKPRYDFTHNLASDNGDFSSANIVKVEMPETVNLEEKLLDYGCRQAQNKKEIRLINTDTAEREVESLITSMSNMPEIPKGVLTFDTMYSMEANTSTDRGDSTDGDLEQNYVPGLSQDISRVEISGKVHLHALKHFNLFDQNSEELDELQTIKRKIEKAGKDINDQLLKFSLPSTITYEDKDVEIEVNSIYRVVSDILPGEIFSNLESQLGAYRIDIGTKARLYVRHNNAEDILAKIAPVVNRALAQEETNSRDSDYKESLEDLSKRINEISERGFKQPNKETKTDLERTSEEADKQEDSFDIKRKRIYEEGSQYQAKINYVINLCIKERHIEISEILDELIKQSPEDLKKASGWAARSDNVSVYNAIVDGAERKAAQLTARQEEIQRKQTKSDKSGVEIKKLKKEMSELKSTLEKITSLVNLLKESKPNTKKENITAAVESKLQQIAEIQTQLDLDIRKIREKENEATKSRQSRINALHKQEAKDMKDSYQGISKLVTKIKKTFEASLRKDSANVQTIYQNNEFDTISLVDETSSFFSVATSTSYEPPSELRVQLEKIRMVELAQDEIDQNDPGAEDGLQVLGEHKENQDIQNEILQKRAAYFDKDFDKENKIFIADQGLWQEKSKDKQHDQINRDVSFADMKKRFREDSDTFDDKMIERVARRLINKSTKTGNTYREISTWMIISPKTINTYADILKPEQVFKKYADDLKGMLLRPYRERTQVGLLKEKSLEEIIEKYEDKAMNAYGVVNSLNQYDKEKVASIFQEIDDDTLKRALSLLRSTKSLRGLQGSNGPRLQKIADEIYKEHILEGKNYGTEVFKNLLKLETISRRINNVLNKPIVSDDKEIDNTLGPNKVSSQDDFSVGVKKRELNQTEEHISSDKLKASYEDVIKQREEKELRMQAEETAHKNVSIAAKKVAEYKDRIALIARLEVASPIFSDKYNNISQSAEYTYLVNALRDSTEKRDIDGLESPPDINKSIYSGNEYDNPDEDETRSVISEVSIDGASFEGAETHDNAINVDDISLENVDTFYPGGDDESVQSHRSSVNNNDSGQDISPSTEDPFTNIVLEIEKNQKRVEVLKQRLLLDLYDEENDDVRFGVFRSNTMPGVNEDDQGYLKFDKDIINQLVTSSDATRPEPKDYIKQDEAFDNIALCMKQTIDIMRRDVGLTLFDENYKPTKLFSDIVTNAYERHIINEEDYNNLIAYTKKDINIFFRNLTEEQDKANKSITVWHSFCNFFIAIFNCLSAGLEKYKPEEKNKFFTATDLNKIVQAQLGITENFYEASREEVRKECDKIESYIRECDELKDPSNIKFYEMRKNLGIENGKFSTEKYKSDVSKYYVLGLYVKSFNKKFDTWHQNSNNSITFGLQINEKLKELSGVIHKYEMGLYDEVVERLKSEIQDARAGYDDSNNIMQNAAIIEKNNNLIKDLTQIKNTQDELNRQDVYSLKGSGTILAFMQKSNLIEGIDSSIEDKLNHLAMLYSFNDNRSKGEVYDCMRFIDSDYKIEEIEQARPRILEGVKESLRIKRTKIQQNAEMKNYEIREDELSALSKKIREIDNMIVASEEIPKEIVSRENGEVSKDVYEACRVFNQYTQNFQTGHTLEQIRLKHLPAGQNAQANLALKLERLFRENKSFNKHMEQSGKTIAVLKHYLAEAEYNYKNLENVQKEAIASIEGQIQNLEDTNAFAVEPSTALSKEHTNRELKITDEARTKLVEMKEHLASLPDSLTDKQKKEEFEKLIKYYKDLIKLTKTRVYDALNYNSAKAKYINTLVEWLAGHDKEDDDFAKNNQDLGELLGVKFNKDIHLQGDGTLNRTAIITDMFENTDNHGQAFTHVKNTETVELQDNSIDLTADFYIRTGEDKEARTQLYEEVNSIYRVVSDILPSDTFNDLDGQLGAYRIDIGTKARLDVRHNNAEDILAKIALVVNRALAQEETNSRDSDYKESLEDLSKRINEISERDFKQADPKISRVRREELKSKIAGYQVKTRELLSKRSSSIDSDRTSKTKYKPK